MKANVAAPPPATMMFALVPMETWMPGWPCRCIPIWPDTFACFWWLAVDSLRVHGPDILLHFMLVALFLGLASMCGDGALGHLEILRCDPMRLFGAADSRRCKHIACMEKGLFVACLEEGSWL